MKKEQIQEFTRRISQSNRGGLVIVIYDILFAYLTEAKEAYGKEQWTNYKESVRHAQRTIDELISSLDFSYAMASDLYRIYVFCRDNLAKAVYKRDMEELLLSERLMKKLYEAFSEAMKQDKSDPLMRNAQQVCAGYTYGREDLIETCRNYDTSRGFLA